MAVAVDDGVARRVVHAHEGLVVIQEFAEQLHQSLVHVGAFGELVLDNVCGEPRLILRGATTPMPWTGSQF